MGDGMYHAFIRLLVFPSLLSVPILGEGVGFLSGFKIPLPFIIGGALALIASFLMVVWMPKTSNK